MVYFFPATNLGGSLAEPLNRIMRKPDFCILCENKGADQVTVQLISIFVFDTLIVYSLKYFKFNAKFQASSHFCGYTGRFVSGLVGNLEDRFSGDAAHLSL